jgi:hypothetical protein
MLSYFPQIYPDELLYSVLARYHRHMCSVRSTQTANELFGVRTIKAGLALQGHLAKLCRRVPEGRGLTPQRLAKECTLYPYYVAFKPDAYAEILLETLANQSVHGLYGRIAPPRFARFCPVCRARMLETFGELYWRRSHQLPGVLVCPDHGAPLSDSTVRPEELANIFEFIPADESNCRTVAAPSGTAAPPCAALLLGIAQSSAALLTEDPRRISFGDLAGEYRRAVLDRGFAKGERIDPGRIAEAYSEIFSPIFGLLPGTDPACGWNWLAAITKSRPSHVFHPLRHVLFRLFLNHRPLCPRLERRLREMTGYGSGPRAAAQATGSYETKLGLTAPGKTHQTKTKNGRSAYRKKVHDHWLEVAPAVWTEFSL